MSPAVKRGLSWLVALKQQHTLRILKSVTEINGHLVTGTPKNGESRAPILPEITLNRTKALLIGNKSKDLLFTGRPRGKAIRQANVRHKSAQMNLDRYARLFESDEVDLAHRVDPMMSETPCHENATRVTRLTLVQVIPNLKPFANQWNESVAPA